MATYVPNATQTSEPVESQTVESAALEFRTLKTRVNSLETAVNTEDTRDLRVPEAVIAVIPAIASRAGKVLGFDAGGDPVVVEVSGTTDPSLRADLAASSGSSLVGWLRGVVGTVSTTLAKWLGWRIPSVFEFMTSEQIADVQAGTELLDVTVAVQAALDAGSVDFPPGTYMIKAHNDAGTFAGIAPPNNRTLNFQSGAILKAITNDKTSYALVNLSGKSNVTINNIKLVGDRPTHTGVTGEWGMGLYIRSSSNIVINGVTAEKMWGDGIYLGDTGAGTNKNIEIRNVVIDDCRRQGISVITADGLLVENANISNIRGTSPSAGIDFEPNDTTNVLRGITMNNIKTSNCAEGVLFYLVRMLGGVNIPIVGITFNNYQDFGSDYGTSCNGLSGPAGGSITFNAPIFTNIKQNCITLRKWAYNAALVIVNNPVFVNPNRAGSGGVYGAAIAISTLEAEGTHISGGLIVNAPKFILESGYTLPDAIKISLRDIPSGVVKNVQITNVHDFTTTMLDSTSWNLLDATNCKITQLLQPTVGNVSVYPTGAIIEDVTNANGRAVKFADGSMICTQTMDADSASNIALGVLFKSSNTSWTYPVQFIYIPSISALPIAGAAYSWIGFATPSNSVTSAYFTCINAATQTAVCSVSLTAVGRWKA